jgi:hypothetical protein
MAKTYKAQVKLLGKYLATDYGHLNFDICDAGRAGLLANTDDGGCEDVTARLDYRTGPEGEHTWNQQVVDDVWAAYGHQLSRIHRFMYGAGLVI